MANTTTGEAPARMLKSANGRAALEVDDVSAAIGAGDHHIQVYSGVGPGDVGSATITAPAIGLLAPPEAIKIFGVWSFNAMAFVPGAPTFHLIPPVVGVAGMQTSIGMYSAMLGALAAGMTAAMVV